MAANVRLRLEQVPVVSKLVEHAFLFVWENNVGVEGLYHQQRFTECASAFAENLQQYSNRKYEKIL